MENKKEKSINDWLEKQYRFALIRTSRNYQRQWKQKQSFT